MDIKSVPSPSLTVTPSPTTSSYIPYRMPTDSNAPSPTTQIQKQYTTTLADAFTALAETGFEGYVSHLTAFLNYLSQQHEVAKSDIFAFRVVTLSMLGQYGSARDLVSTAFSVTLDKEDISPALTPVTEAIASLSLQANASSKQKLASEGTCRQGAPPGSIRPPPMPLSTGSERPLSGVGAPLVAVHSVDSAGLPQMKDTTSSCSIPSQRASTPIHRQPSPPPPALPPRPSASPSLPANARPQPPHPHVPVAHYDPRTYTPHGPQAVQPGTNAVKRKSISPSPSIPQYIPTPPYSPMSYDSSGARQPGQQQMYFPPPPMAAGDRAPPPHMQSPQHKPAYPQHFPPQHQIQGRRQPAQSQHLHPTVAQPRAHPHPPQLPQQQQAVDIRRQSYQQQWSSKSTIPVEPRRTSAPSAALPRSPAPNGYQGFTGPALAAKPKPSKMDKVKKFAKGPAGKVAMRVGTGMVIATLTGGLIGSEVGDMDFGGGEDVDIGGGEDFAGGEDFGAAGEEYVVSEEYAVGEEYTADEALYCGGEEYMGAEGATFEENVVYGEYSEDYYSGDYGNTQDYAFEEYPAAGDAGTESYGYEETATSDLPGQTGPCFEDNVILSAAAG